MCRRFFPILFGLFPLIIAGQEKALESLMSDSAMIFSSASLSIINTENNEIVFEYNPEKSLMPASTMKLISSSAALELLGPDYFFKTTLGYTGKINKNTGKLEGDLVIKGGGDPALGSSYFKEEYGNFIDRWINEIKSRGIKKINGRVIADDSYYDYKPVPARWLWEDIGNYYGAGAYGLSVFDNTYEIHLSTSSEGSIPVITEIVPKECTCYLSSWLSAKGSTDNGYVFAAPYGKTGWLSGTLPVNRDDFVLKASINDPALILAAIIDNKLDSAGILTLNNPSTSRIEKKSFEEITPFCEVFSPPLKKIIEVLNHESVNLFAEHLVKELGKVFYNSGSTSSGIDVLYKFLIDKGINTKGMFIEDGSGLSPVNAINTRGLAMLLSHLKKEGKYFEDFYNSLPEGGKEGTLKKYFTDPVFESRLRAKSGSITRVRCYAGYIRTISGRELSFSIIINNYTGPSQKIITGIEDILKETILYK